MEALEQGKAMLHTFTHDANNEECTPYSEPVIEDLAHWTMTAALYVIAGVAFNLKMLWPTYSVSASTIPRQSSLTTPTNSTTHTMSFQESFGYLDYLGFVIAFPRSFLRYSPFKSMRRILACTEEFVLLVRELINNAEQNDSKVDLLSVIVKAGNADEKMKLSESETIGNFFAFIVAGHETTSSTVQTALLMLACEPDVQDKVHEELKTIWASTEGRQDWTYDDYPKMRYTMGVIVSFRGVLSGHLMTD